MLGFIFVKHRESSHKELAVENVDLGLLQRMQVIRLNQHLAQIQFTKELFEPASLVVLAGGVAGLAVAAGLLRSRTPRPVLLIQRNMGSQCRATAGGVDYRASHTLADTD